MEILEKILIWVERGIGWFLLPVEFDQQDTPDRGIKFMLPAVVKPVKVTLAGIKV